MRQAANMAGSHFQIFLDSQRELIRKRDLAAAKQRQWRATLEQWEDAEHREIRRRFLLADPESSREDVFIQEIPSGNTALAPLAPDRVESYRHHIETVIDAAMALLHQEPDTNQARESYLPVSSANRENGSKLEARLRQQPGLRATCENLCGHCRGACCNHGNTSAYLNADTILRTLRQRPGLTPEEILTDYLSHLRSETVADSCINHTGTGCCLPRDLRSDTCNGFFCDSLIRYQNAVEYCGDSGEVLAVRRARKLNECYAPDADRSIVDIVLVDAEGVSPVDVDFSGIETIAAAETCESDNATMPKSTDA
jgi:hypothetical protein